VGQKTAPLISATALPKLFTVK